MRVRVLLASWGPPVLIDGLTPPHFIDIVCSINPTCIYIYIYYVIYIYYIYIYIIYIYIVMFLQLS